MSIFTVNKSLCDGCNVCLKVCPNNALTVSLGLCVMDYDKCMACGNCFKVCPKNAIKLNIRFDKINSSIFSSDSYNQQKERIKTLSSEIDIAQNELEIERNNLNNIVSKLNEAVVIVGKNRELLLYNKSFIDMLDKKSLCFINCSEPKTENLMLKELVNDDLYKRFLEVQNSGKDQLWLNSKLGDFTVSTSIYSIRRGEKIMLIFRNIADSLVARQEATKQIEAVINQNMSMVQKIGFLLGEEIAATTKVLYKTMTTIDPKYDGK